MEMEHLKVGGAIPFAAGGCREEVERVYRMFADAGMTGFAVPVEGLVDVEITVPGRTFRGLSGIEEYISLIKQRR